MHYTDEFGNKYELRFMKGEYMMGGIAIVCEDLNEEDGETWWEPYADVTVWLPAPNDEGCAFLDTNNSKRLVDAMVDAGYVKLTGYRERSGYCTYPEGRFDEEWLAGLEEL